MSLNDSLNELKYALRKREFPFCARDALTSAEDLLTVKKNSSQSLTVQQTELAMEIVAEFVFNEIEKGGYHRKYTALQELELLLVISDHMLFDRCGTEASRNAVFLSLFPACKIDRIRLLVALVSMSISARTAPVLNAAGVVIQQLGYASKYSTLFASELVKSHFLLLPSNNPCVLALPKVSPMFAANFLTAVTNSFGYLENDKPKPPKKLQQIILDWVKETPSLCLAPLLHKLQPSLPQGSIPMPAITPYVGLIKWCVFSLACGEDQDIFSELSTQIREFLPEAERVTDRASNIIMAQELASQVVARMVDVKSAEPVIERLGGFIQAALVTNALYGPKQDLWRQLRNLPKNSSVQKILKEYGSLV